MILLRHRREFVRRKRFWCPPRQCTSHREGWCSDWDGTLDSLDKLHFSIAISTKLRDGHGRNQDVIRFEVTVHHLFSMQVLHTGSNLWNCVKCRCRSKWKSSCVASSNTLPDENIKINRHVFHHNCPLIWVSMTTNDLHNIWVIQTSHNSSLFLKLLFSSNDGLFRALCILDWSETALPDKHPKFYLTLGVPQRDGGRLPSRFYAVMTNLFRRKSERRRSCVVIANCEFKGSSDLEIRSSCWSAYSKLCFHSASAFPTSSCVSCAFVLLASSVSMTRIQMGVQVSGLT